MPNYCQIIGGYVYLAIISCETVYSYYTINKNQQWSQTTWGNVTLIIYYVHVYIDVLLCRLKRSGYGCYIGHMFCGALGYADDVIIMAPTVTATKQMLNICADYGIQYNVLFNPYQTKCIHININLKCNIVLNVQFMGKLIETVNYDNHLGFPIGYVNQQDVIAHAVNQFTMKVNIVVSHF